MTRETPRTLRRCLLAALAIGGLAAAADDPIHVCQDDDGKVFSQTEPCDGGPAREATRGGRPAAATTPSARIETRAVPRSTTGRTLDAPLPRRSPTRREPLPVPLGPVDPRFASPETTWRTFEAAVRRGDLREVLECFSPSALEALGPDARSLELETLRETLRSYTRIDSAGDLGPFWCLRAQRRSGKPAWVFLERSLDGCWKIAAI